MKKPINSLGLILIFLISLVPLYSLLKPGMYWAHDSKSHVVRIASFYQSLSEGNIFPRWSASLNAGYGHPIFMFLYPLPSYAASAFHFLGFSITTSIKLVLALGYLGSGILMYLWLKKHFSNRAALIGAAVWQLAPYRFVNLYVRNALGEHTAFLFVPLSLLAVYFLVTKPTTKKIVFTSLAVSGLILAHNAVSLMFLSFIFAYAIILLLGMKRKLSALGHSLLAVFLGFGLSAFFWIPAFFEGKYTLRPILFNDNSFIDHFPSLKQLILPNWGYGNSHPGFEDDLSLQIGLAQWIASILGVFVLVKNWQKINLKLKLFSLLAVVTFVGSCFLLLPISIPVWHLLSILKKFQFPWRLLILPVFASSILASLSTQQLPGLSRFKPRELTVALVVFALFFQNHNYFKPRGDYLPADNQLISEYLGTTDTGESTPKWAVRFQEKRPESTLGVVWGAPIDYQIHRRESEVHEQTITTTVKTQVSENTLYFPGWTVYVDGQKTGIIWTDPNWRGVITYPVPPGTHQVKVVFEETKLRQFANTLSLLSLAFISALLIKAYPKHFFA